MRVGDWLSTRTRRLLALTIALAGWALVIAGIAADDVTLAAIGVIVTAIVNLAFVKALVELAPARRGLEQLHEATESTKAATDRMSRQLTDARRELESMKRGVASMQSALDLARKESATQERRLSEIDSGISRMGDRVREGQDGLRATNAEAAANRREVRLQENRIAQIATIQESTREALAITRGLTEKLAAHARSQIAPEGRLSAVATSGVETPLLSIAIPSFDRPEKLTELLDSIEEEVSAIAGGLVEVCITDDASPDPDAVEKALTFAETHRYASMRMRGANVGIERNVLEAGEVCRGTYLLLVGNDDVLLPGSLETIIADLETTQAPMLLYAKRRINHDGSPKDDIPGSTPIDIAQGTTHIFPTMIDAARRQGLLSTFGYVGPIVVRREMFLAVDPAPYLDLTMYAPLLVMVEAFAGEPVFYRNQATILHRTPTPSRKHAESIGRREESFMAGGRLRHSRYFGTSLAAALQRLIDKGVVTYVDLLTMPENLMSDRPLVEWIAANRAFDPTVDDTFEPSVVRDAERFFTGVDGGRST